MVEAGANEIPEAEILDALDIAHVGDQEARRRACSELGEKAGKARSSRSRRRRSTRACSTQIKALARRRRSTRPPRSRTSSTARTPRRPSRRRSSSSTPATRGRRRRTPSAAQQRAARVRQAREDDHPRAHRRPEEAPGRPRHGRDPRRSRSRPACCRARTARRCSPAARRRRCRVVALGTTREEMRLDTLGLETSKRYFHHYNFPPFSVGRGRLHARPEAPRHRPRRARRARAGPDDPVAGGLPVHDPRRVGHPRVQRLLVDGLGLRLLAVADGRRRADQARRSPASPWA